MVRVNLKTDGYFDPRKQGHAYVAIIRRDESGKVRRDFINNVNRVWDRKRKRYIAEWEFDVQVGTVIEARLSASWRNDYRCYYAVEEDGLKAISKEEALLRRSA